MVVEAAKKAVAETMSLPTLVMSEIKDYAAHMSYLGLDKEKAAIPATFSKDSRFLNLIRAMCSQKAYQKPYGEVLRKEILDGPDADCNVIFCEDIFLCKDGKDTDFLKILFRNKNLQSVQETVLFCENSWNYITSDNGLETNSVLFVSENVKFPFLITIAEEVKAAGVVAVNPRTSEQKVFVFTENEESLRKAVKEWENLCNSLHPFV